MDQETPSEKKEVQMVERKGSEGNGEIVKTTDKILGG
jgi:hypothetical protein